MYPLKYKTGETVQAGDFVNWTSDDATIHHGEIRRIIYQDIPGANGTGQLDWSPDDAQRKGNIVLAAPHPPKSLHGLSLILQETREEKIPWEKLVLEKRGKAQAYYYSGELVRNGDYVAIDEGNSPMRVGRIQVFFAKSEYESWYKGDVMMISLTRDGGDRCEVFPYFDDDGTPHSAWQDVYFIRRGDWPAEGKVCIIPVDETN